LAGRRKTTASFLADEAAWETIVRNKVKAVEDLGCKYWLNTE